MSPPLRRLPIESPQPILVFAVARVVLAVLALMATVAMDFVFGGDMALYLLLLVLPWTGAVLYLAYRNPEVVLSLRTAAVDFALLAGLELVVPESYVAIRVVALFLIAVHADLQGERRGVAIAVVGAVPLSVLALVAQDGPITGELLVFSEILFVGAAIATGLSVGRLRTAASTSHERARMLTRRTLQSESEARRQVAESLHDGPVQELIGLDMLLSAAGSATTQGDSPRAGELIAEARTVAMRNVRALREEIVDLGPYAFEELSFGQAVENCVGTWERRYGLRTLLAIEDVDLPSELAGDLFRITQEAVVNAGRHARADTVTVSMRQVDGVVELRVMDDGRGFSDVDPLSAAKPGHLGIAAMRERTELLDGELEIETGERGTKVFVRVPLTRRVRLRRQR